MKHLCNPKGRVVTRAVVDGVKTFVVTGQVTSPTTVEHKRIMSLDGRRLLKTPVVTILNTHATETKDIVIRRRKTLRKHGIPVPA